VLGWIDVSSEDSEQSFHHDVDAKVQRNWRRRERSQIDVGLKLECKKFKLVEIKEDLNLVNRANQC